MDFLKRLFGGGGEGDRGMYFYIRSRRSGEIVRVRLDPNQFSQQIEGTDTVGYFIHKTVVGQRSFERMEAEFHFDRNRRLTDKSVTGGEFVEKADWLAQQNNGPDGK
ncbi:MAG: hypothetical protein JW910_23330 [Anaerolineae bacterium]|nr:hypothetical protein [Anaerolineae bacterium]